MPAFIARRVLKEGSVAAAQLQDALAPRFEEFGAYYHLAEECDDAAAARVVSENLQAMEAAGYVTLIDRGGDLEVAPNSGALESLAFLANISPAGHVLDQAPPVAEALGGGGPPGSHRPSSPH